MNIYLVFYIFLFELVLLGMLNILFIIIESINLNIIYNIEIILDCEYIRSKNIYLIK